MRMWRSRDDGATVPAERPSMTADSPAPTARHILVVDDDTDLRGQIVDYLSEHGYQVHAAADARTMDQALESAPIDLVVLDVMLPGEDGLSICRRLAAEGGPAIIMVSAMGEEIDRVLGLELGRRHYLAKPCSPRELLARVRAVFRRLDEVRRRAQAGQGLSVPGLHPRRPPPPAPRAQRRHHPADLGRIFAAVRVSGPPAADPLARPAPRHRPRRGRRCLRSGGRRPDQSAAPQAPRLQ